MLAREPAKILPGRGGGKVSVHRTIFPDRGATARERNGAAIPALVFRGGVTLAFMKTGDTVPDFELPDQTGTPRKLSALLADGPVVLFFYPAAMTPGCTREACHFRDLAAEFAAVGANRVGVSTDPVPKQAQFADMRKFDYPLLSDVEGKVATQFGVKRGLLGKLMPVKRTTFVIDTDRTVLDVISSEFNFNSHADKALRTLRERSSA